MGYEQMSVLELVIYLYNKNYHTVNCILHLGFLKIRLNQIFSYIFMLNYTDSPPVQGSCAKAHSQYGDSFCVTNLYTKREKNLENLLSHNTTIFVL